jgi:hypothetical protein
MNNPRDRPSPFQRITVLVGDPEHEEHFNGYWLIPPDPVLARSGEAGVTSGAFFGIGCTDDCRIAVLIQDADEGRPSWLSFHPSLNQACYEADLIPLDILHAAKLARRVQKMASSAEKVARKQEARRRKLVVSELMLFGVSSLAALPPLVQRSLKEAGQRSGAI